MFHGCPECFSDNREDTYHPHTRQLLKELYALIWILEIVSSGYAPVRISSTTKLQNMRKIRYVNFTSLYPWVNKYCQYPVCHTKVITQGFRDIKDYFGIAEVKILPPRGLYQPVLPYRLNSKLRFPLCRTCADSENQNLCTCSEEESELTGTWCTPEIQTALRLAYTLKFQ